MARITNQNVNQKTKASNHTKQTMKQLPDSERPYEKCLQYGEQALSDAELLAAIIRTGTPGESAVELARRLLSEFQYPQGLPGLFRATIPELCRLKGIGTVKAVQLRCIAELSKRITKAGFGNQPVFREPDDIANYYMEQMRHETRERVIVMMLNGKNRLLHEMIISTGTVNSSLVSPREIFLEALRYHAVCICLLHNHPSGDPSPSKEDILITRRLREAGEIIGISLLDHIIIGDNTYHSMKKRGIM